MSFKVKNPLRIIVLMHEDLIPPETLKGHEEKDIVLWKTEYDVVSTLRQIGHEVWPVGLRSELGVIREAIERYRPHIAFNLLEEFDGYPHYDQHVVSYLELSKLPYTGCNPRGLTLARDKALTKMVLTYHRVAVPNFAVFPLKHKVRRPGRLPFPLLVKSLVDEGSAGIAQASVVYNDEKLAERVDFIHRQYDAPAIAEQYIDGREIYVGVIGNQRLQSYPPWELIIENLPEGSANIATSMVKWDPKYQERRGVITKAAELEPEIVARFAHVSKRIYRLLHLSGYARIDYRLTPDGRIYVLEANPNPQISTDGEFADSAEFTGLEYGALLQKILTLGLSYSANR